MRIDLAPKSAVRYVAYHMRERDFLEFSAVNHADTRLKLAGDLSERFGDRTDVFCAWSGTSPIAIGAAVETRPNVVSVLFFATGKFGKIARPLTRYIRDVFLAEMRRSGAHRIDAVTLAGYDRTASWLGELGLQREATCQGWGKNGEAFELYSWVSDAVRPPSH